MYVYCVVFTIHVLKILSYSELSTQKSTHLFSMKIHYEHQTPIILFHIHLGLKLVNRLSNGIGLMDLNGRASRSIIPITHSNDSSILSMVSVQQDQLDYNLSENQLADTSNKMENEDEKVSDDDFYVDDFESDNDGDANDGQ